MGGIKEKIRILINIIRGTTPIKLDVATNSTQIEALKTAEKKAWKSLALMAAEIDSLKKLREKDYQRLYRLRKKVSEIEGEGLMAIQRSDEACQSAVDLINKSNKSHKERDKKIHKFLMEQADYEKRLAADAREEFRRLKRDVMLVKNFISEHRKEFDAWLKKRKK